MKGVYRIDIMTLFPETVGDVLSESILGRAQERDILRIETHQIRDYTQNKQKQVDDYPYGGGRGAILQADPLYRCWEHIREASGNQRPHTIFLSPCGKTFTQDEARRLQQDYDHLVLVCGHYEGIDQRFIEECVDEELSLGDFVLTGGEIAAMAVADAVCRLVPGVLADPECFRDESHWAGLLEYPQYSRPEVWHGRAVPQALLTGNHQEVARWRRKEQLRRTKERRPDLFAAFVPEGSEDELALRTVDREERAAALTEPFVLRPAVEDDLPGLMVLAHAAQVRFRERGVDQWQDGYPSPSHFRMDLERGEGYVLTYGDRLAGFFALALRPEPCYDQLTDGHWRGEEPYAVLHRCVLAPEFQGLGISDRLLQEAERTALELGFSWMRADTHKKNKPMSELLRRGGFQYRGNVEVRVKGGHDPRRLAFEKKLER